MPGLLDRQRIIARPGFNRWLVPPAALAIHLCIGMAYGFSVFWLPLSRALGVAAPVVCPTLTLAQSLVTTTCDWRVSDLGWIYTLFFVCLGSSAALWGGWLERAGPRKAGVVSAGCWCGGILMAAGGIVLHQLWVMWLGAGVLGGISLGLGYISPVSTLIKWFPDRRGMATGMAIMGFGGGAMIGAPLADRLMAHFRTSTSVGVWQTFVVLAAVYFVSMMAGAFAYRVPPAGWSPGDGAATAGATGARPVSLRSVRLRDAHRTPQFWLIWSVLCLNVSAGIGVIGMASPLLQEIFGASAAVAAGFTGLISLFNIGGRFFWASLSDRVGRKTTYATFFVLGIALYALTPSAARSGHQAAFVLAVCVIVSMYGGGFATIPAYLADVFGTQFVGAIHGRLLTAWSTAGIIGPVVVNYLRESQIAAGVPRAQVYDLTLYILAGLLLLGLVANALVTPLADRWFMPDSELAALHVAQTPANVSPGAAGGWDGGGTARLANRAGLDGRRRANRLGRVGDARADARPLLRPHVGSAVFLAPTMAHDAHPGRSAAPSAVGAMSAVGVGNCRHKVTAASPFASPSCDISGGLPAGARSTTTLDAQARWQGDCCVVTLTS